MAAGWTTLAPMPTARSEAGAAADNGLLYVVGGWIGGGLATLQVYNPATNTWMTKTPMPTPREEMAVGEINGLLYVAGGFDAYPPFRIRGATVAALQVYDPATDTWTTRTAMPSAIAGRGAVVNGKLYVIGYSGGSCSSVVEAYDPATNSWSYKSPMPTARCNLAVVALNGLIYALGGGDTSGIVAYSTVEVYNPATDRWTTAAPMPTGRSGLSAGVVSGSIYAIGGDNTYIHSLDTVEAYNPASNTWIEQPALPTARRDLITGVVNNVLYAVGGVNGSGSWETKNEAFIQSATVTQLAISAVASTTAGMPFNFTITAENAAGNTIPGYRGTVHFSSSDLAAVLPADYTFTAADNGVHTFTAILKTLDRQSITVTDTATGSVHGSATVTVTLGSTTTLGISTVANAIAGMPFNLTITAKDAGGNTVPGYRGTVHFTSSDPAAVLPADYTFTAADNGMHTFTTTLNTLGTQPITATDTATNSVTGSTTVIVTPDSATMLGISAVAGITAGRQFSLTVTAQDAAGKTFPAYQGPVHFASSDPAAVLPADYTFTAADNGVHTFTATLWTAGSQIVTASDIRGGSMSCESGYLHCNNRNQYTSITGSTTVTVTPASTTTSSVTGSTTVTMTLASTTTSTHDLFVIGLDNEVWAEKLDAASHPVGSYFLTQPGAVKSFGAGHDAAGRPELFVIGLDDQVYGLHFDANGDPAGGYFLAAGGQVKYLSVGHDAFNRPEAFVIGLDDQVYAQRFDANGNPVGGYFRVAPGRVDALAVGNDTAGRPEVFVIGLDSRLWILKFDLNGNPVGGYFVAPGNYDGGGCAVPPVRSLSIGHDAAGNPEVFVIGGGDQVWAQKFDANGNPQGYYAPSGGACANPIATGAVKSISAGNDAAGNPELFAIGLDDQVYAQKLDANGNPVGSYFLTQPGQVKALTAGQDARGHPEVFVIGLDDQVWVQRLDAAGNPAGSYFLTAVGQIRLPYVPRPLLVVNPSSLSASAVYNTPGPDPSNPYHLYQGFTVSNEGAPGSFLTISVRVGNGSSLFSVGASGLCQATPYRATGTQCTLAAGQAAGISIVMNNVVLLSDALKTYSDTIYITDLAENVTLTVPVSYTVYPLEYPPQDMKPPATTCYRVVGEFPVRPGYPSGVLYTSTDRVAAQAYYDYVKGLGVYPDLFLNGGPC
jgi:hypothetical protein